MYFNIERELRRQTGGGGRIPSAPKPALIFPPRLIRSKKGRSVGFAGTGLSFPFHNTNRGASGSPRTKSSFKPLSTCHCIRINKTKEKCTQSKPLPDYTYKTFMQQIRYKNLRHPSVIDGSKYENRPTAQILVKAYIQWNNNQQNYAT